MIALINLLYKKLCFFVEALELKTNVLERVAVCDITEGSFMRRKHAVYKVLCCGLPDRSGYCYRWNMQLTRKRPE